MRQIKSFVKLGFLALASMVIGVTACTSDKTPEEAVDGSRTEIPAEPGSDTGAYQPENVYFGFDQHNITSSAHANLDQLGAYLQKNPSVKVEVAGHADERGGEEYNMALGERRAYSVKNYLTKLGVEESRIKTISYGKLRPAVSGHDTESWAKNRRAEFTLSN